MCYVEENIEAYSEDYKIHTHVSINIYIKSHCKHLVGLRVGQSFGTGLLDLLLEKWIMKSLKSPNPSILLA